MNIKLLIFQFFYLKWYIIYNFVSTLIFLKIIYKGRKCVSEFWLTITINDYLKSKFNWCIQKLKNDIKTMKYEKNHEVWSMKYALDTSLTSHFHSPKILKKLVDIKSKTGKILLMKKSFSGQFKRLQSNTVSRFYGKDKSPWLLTSVHINLNYLKILWFFSLVLINRWWYSVCPLLYEQ